MVVISRDVKWWECKTLNDWSLWVHQIIVIVSYCSKDRAELWYSCNAYNNPIEPYVDCVRDSYNLNKQNIKLGR